MTITTSAACPYPELVTLCHEYYAVGKRITDLCLQQSVTNATMNAVCAEIKASRVASGAANTTHTGILTILAAI